MLKFISKNLNLIYLFFGLCLSGLFDRQFGSFITDFLEIKGGFFIVLIVSVLFFVSAIFSYRKNNKLLSFLFLYFGICFLYFYTIINFDFWPTALTYAYYFIVFFYIPRLFYFFQAILL